MAYSSFETLIVRSQPQTEKVEDIWEFLRTQKNGTSENVCHDLFNGILTLLTLDGLYFSQASCQKAKRDMLTLVEGSILYWIIGQT